MIKNKYKVKAPYPLVSILSAFLLLGYYFVSSNRDLAQFYNLPSFLFLSPLPETLFAGFALIVLLELRNLQTQKRHQQDMLQKIETQVEELLENKKRLNAKAHIYANHADKLKLFISDKLLEYIEYDEKFIHFKNIASEVRHNGVICYDKIATLLEGTLQTTEVFDTDEQQQYREALDSLRYLWDLLDLSTTDNIALHIANQVCSSEEILFQSELDHQNIALPDSPVFEPRGALERALSRSFGTNTITREESIIKVLEQDKVLIHYQPTDALLGNENHVVLALENLITNAQFFSGRARFRQRGNLPEIIIELDQVGEYIRYRIYNRGPHINEESATKLFQLGFSTRRVKANHGKGLGLYFVNEIVKGYDGKVTFNNIYNTADILSIRIETADGEVITDVIELVFEGDGPACRKSGSDSLARTLEWGVSGSLESIEITHQSDQKTHRRLSEELSHRILLDPSQRAHPRWYLDVSARGQKSTILKFTPLDISGVEFEIKLPSLTARMEGDLLATDEDDMERQVAHLSSRFKALEE